MEPHDKDTRPPLTAGAQDAVIASDVQGRITAWNPAAQRLLGWSAREALGQPLEALTVPAEKADEAQRVQQLLQQGQDVLPIATRRLDRHGGAIEVLLSATPSWDAQGRAAGAVTTLRRAGADGGGGGGGFQAAAAVAARSPEVSAALNAILNSAASAIITTDLQGLVTSFNPAAEAMFRLPEAQALARPITDFSDREEDTPGPAAAGAGRRGERSCIRADGTRFPGLLSISMLRGDAGQALGILCIVTDLTERQRMEQALRERTVQAEAANRAKSAFLAHMSHEFRTPLNAVIGLSQLLQQMALPEKPRSFVHHIHQAGAQLLALTDDVLDLSRIEAGEMVLDQQPFELPALLDAVCALVRPQADAKGLALRLDAPDGLPERLVGDALRIKQVLINLLGNAVKFTASGSVALGVRELARSGAGVTLRLEVVDTGIGIAAEQQAQIFEPFAQADSSTTRRFGGTGLGLSIVRRLVAMMDGELALQSEPGCGSRFSVTLALGLAGTASQDG